MSVGFAIAILLLMLAIFCFRWRQASQVARLGPTGPPPKRPALSTPQTVSGFKFPSGYCFHPGHTWMAEPERETARVGLDSFAANLLGSVEKIVVIGEQRWVRQGQKLMTVTAGSAAVDLLSPLEGVVAAINAEVVKDPGLAVRDPYGEGWVCAVKSPHMDTNRRNLMPGTLAARWMENSFKQLRSMLAEADSALAQDGGLLASRSLSMLRPEMLKRVVNEFFLT